jgi:hypothetical protein
VILGIDYAWGRPGGNAIKSAGYNFVCRYLSYDSSKNIDLPETKDLTNNSLSIVVVWESTSDRALSGFSAGRDDAMIAANQIHNAGLPNNMPIYFAVDFDASPPQQAAIDDYLRGAAAVIGTERVGVYGSYYVVKRCFDNGTAAFGWQTAAWSGGKREPRAHIYQRIESININEVSCDVNEALKESFGQSVKGANMAQASEEQIKDIIRILLTAILGLDGNGIISESVGKRPSAIRKECEGIVESYVPYFQTLSTDVVTKIQEFWSSTQGTAYHDQEIPQVYDMAQSWHDKKPVTDADITAAAQKLKQAQDEFNKLIGV